MQAASSPTPNPLTSSSGTATPVAATPGAASMPNTVTQSQTPPSEQQQQQQTPTSASIVPTHPKHLPSLAGSVIEAPDGLGGTTLIRIHNMSSTANLGVRLDLKQIALRCRNTEYNPKRFSAVIMRLREPRATAIIFQSGKICVTGCKSVHNSSLAVKRFAYIIERVGFKPQEQVEFKVHNMTGTVDVGFPIRLEGLVYAHSSFSSYEPELFPGLIYRLVEPRVVFLIFVSGKIIMTGAKNEDQLCEALRKLHPVLIEYRKARVMPMPWQDTASKERKEVEGEAREIEHV